MPLCLRRQRASTSRSVVRYCTWSSNMYLLSAVSQSCVSIIFRFPPIRQHQHPPHHARQLYITIGLYAQKWMFLFPSQFSPLWGNNSRAKRRSYHTSVICSTSNCIIYFPVGTIKVLGFRPRRSQFRPYSSHTITRLILGSVPWRADHRHRFRRMLSDVVHARIAHLWSSGNHAWP